MVLHELFFQNVYNKKTCECTKRKLTWGTFYVLYYIDDPQERFKNWFLSENQISFIQQHFTAKKNRGFGQLKWAFPHSLPSDLFSSKLIGDQEIRITGLKNVHQR